MVKSIHNAQMDTRLLLRLEEPWNVEMLVMTLQNTEGRLEMRSVSRNRLRFERARELIKCVSRVNMLGAD